MTYLFVVWGGDCASLLATSPLPTQTQDVALMAAAVMLVLAGTLILLSEKDLASRWGIRLIETDDLAEEGRRVELVAATRSRANAACRHARTRSCAFWRKAPRTKPSNASCS